ncbi:hypothetical protein [Dickeya fangzhongdai]|uniref:hypothetical protein n=1 Tax=Dickeya fangzhongdai TaxID=1778540 RepID=UPI001AD9F1B3|nr:hypothetical protein [Dickeya fangzhongdai]MBO8132484.1 hypothetical protein [Dickeya fangzhongdai]
MNPEEFIRKHVINTLIQEGYSQEQADKGGGRGDFLLSPFVETLNEAPKHF